MPELAGRRYVAIVLAAGRATRFGDKLSADLRGEPLLFHAIRAAKAAPVMRVIVVVRPGSQIGSWPGDPAVQAVRLKSGALSDSLKAGIVSAADADGAFVFLGDMPCIPHGLAQDLALVIGCSFAAMPRHAGRPGHPVLLSARAFPAITELNGDAGAGRLLRQRTDVAFIDCADPGVLFDVDRPDDLINCRSL